MKFVLSILTLSVVIPAFAQNLGDIYKPHKHWVNVLNQGVTSEGSWYVNTPARCIIDKDQEVRVIDKNQDEVLLRLIGIPQRGGTACPNFVVYKLAIEDLTEYTQITDTYSSNYCDLPDGEKSFVDNAIDGFEILGMRKSVVEYGEIASVQCEE